MYYRIDRTFLTNAEGESELSHDTTPYLVAAGDAVAAATVFVSNEKGRLLSAVSSFPGDKATATAWVERRLYTIFVERGAEAVTSRRRSGLDDSSNRRPPQ